MFCCFVVFWAKLLCLASCARQCVAGGWERLPTAAGCRLWSNEALYCRSHVSIPLYEDSPAASRASPTPVSRPLARQASADSAAPRAGPAGAAGPAEESVNDFFKRIDRNVRRTKKVVRQLNRVTE